MMAPKQDILLSSERAADEGQMQVRPARSVTAFGE